MLKEKEDLDCRATAAGKKSSETPSHVYTHESKIGKKWKKRTKRREGEVTSVPWRRVACVANVFIFSLYSWAALLLYLALAALVVHPCWLKNAICHQKKRRTKVHTKNSVARALVQSLCPCTHRIGVASHLHAPKLKPRPIEIQLSGPGFEQGHLMAWHDIQLSKTNQYWPQRIQMNVWFSSDVGLLYTIYLIKDRWTPRDLCVPEQSIHRNTPYVMLAQLGFFTEQSKQI